MKAKRNMRICVTRMVGSMACIALWAGLAGAAEPATTVLVTDFQTPPGAAWTWARRGLPELAVEALNERGIVTVDRDLLPVLQSEHELTAGGGGACHTAENTDIGVSGANRQTDWR